jgi:hypothetical protein
VTPAEERDEEERRRQQRFIEAGGEREFTPKVGDTIRGIWAGEKNPQRDGFYVRTVRRERARVNPGVWYELTDGKGNNWQYRASDTVRIAKAVDVQAALARKDALLRQAMEALQGMIAGATLNGWKVAGSVAAEQSIATISAELKEQDK